MIRTETSTKGKDLLNLILLSASIPFHLLYVAPERKRVEPENSFDTLVKFTLSEKNFKNKQRQFLIAGSAFIVLSIASIYWKHSQFLLVAYSTVILYHLNLAFQLNQFEKGSRLVYDWEFGVYEHRSAKGTVVFKNEDIDRIVLHESGFNTRIADIYLKKKVIRITNKLVDFDRIPLLDENGIGSNYHPFLFSMPKSV